MTWIKTKFRRIFCWHIHWKENFKEHPARRFGAKIWECTDCGKVVACEPWNPPINYVEK